MALNKKLIVLSGVGLVFAGLGAGVIGYKASQVADGQKQMDDSKASMGGQLSFGLASPLAVFANPASFGNAFLGGMTAKIGADAQLGSASYVNLSDQIQADIVTGVAHSIKGLPNTLGDAQSALKTTIEGAANAAVLAGIFHTIDHEINNLRASDVRRMLNNDLSDTRLKQLFGEKATFEKDVKPIVEDLSKASVISLNVGYEDIFEAALNGKTLTDLFSNVDPSKMADPAMQQVIGGDIGQLIQGFMNPSVPKATLNAIGSLNGALSTIRRLNPEAKIIVGLPRTFADNSPSQIVMNQLQGSLNLALNMAAMTQDIKTGSADVAPVDPVSMDLNPATPSTVDSLTSIYATTDPTTPYAQIKGAVDAVLTKVFIAMALQKMDKNQQAGINSLPDDAAKVQAIQAAMQGRP